MEKLFSIVFSLVILILSIIEKKRINNIITPFTLAAWPFLVIILLNNFLLGYFDFKPVTTNAQLFILANLVIIWIIGIIFNYQYVSRLPARRNIDTSSVFADISKFQFLLIAIAWITIILNFKRASDLITSHGGIWFLGDQRYEDIMSKGGIVSHFVEVGKICFIFLIFTFKYHKYKLISVITLIFLVLSTSASLVKYHVMWLVIISFLFYVWTKPVKYQLKSILIISICLFLIMNSFWITMTLVWGTFSFENEDVWTFFLRQFFNYFVSGPIVLDYWLQLGDIKPDWTLFIVLKNAINVLIGNPERIDAIKYMGHGFFEVAPQSYSNVGTSFGVYYLIGGYIFSFFMTSITGLVMYYVYYQSVMQPRKLNLFLNVLFLTICTLNFFGQYFTLLTIYEMIVIYILFLGIFKLLNKARLTRKIDRNNATI